MILLLWLLNFAISIFNAWACGKTWNESKHAKGLPHFLNWMGAIMSASGFTWCYLIVIAFLGATIPAVEQEDGANTTLLTIEQLQVFMDLGYLVVVFPILGSGIAITIHAWGVFWRRRSFGSGAIAAYDTFAMVYNISSALHHVPRAGRSVFGYFWGDDSSDNRGKTLIFMLVLLAAIGGILTTRWIILSVAKSTASKRAFAYQDKIPEPEFEDNPSPWGRHGRQR